MAPERHTAHLPEWARRERRADLEWIRENLHVLEPVAHAGYADSGRGAIVIDTTATPIRAGHPFGYLPQELFEQGDDEGIKRMVREYDPRQELVLVLIKSDNRTSTYRVTTRARRA
jgi:hypothetical protein